MKLSFVTMSIASLTTIFSLSGAQQAPRGPRTSTIAYVSAQRIVAESNEGKAELARIQAMQQQKASELQAKQQTLEATRQRLAQSSDGSARLQLQQQEQQQRLELERATAQVQMDLQAFQRQMNADLQGRVRSIVSDLVRAQDLQLVLNGDAAVIWGATALDLTATVVQKLNETAPPAKPKL